MSRRLALAFSIAVLGGMAGASGAAADVVWLCKPGEDPNPCVGSMETTIQSEGEPDRVENPLLPADPPIDCFYVYPTVSMQPTLNANKAKDPEIVAVAEYQAARFSLKCRVYAPVYRQRTLVALNTATSEQAAEAFRIAYGDVKEAWEEYLARHNDGRGVVLIGHSQGTRMLRQLGHDEIDSDAELRSRIVSALLLGGNVLVRRGETAGGDFQHLPVCTGDSQTGCVVAWSTFNEPPPDNARFGRSPTEDPGNGMPWGPDYEVVCTNPASLGVNERRPLQTLTRTEPFPGLIGVLALVMYGGPPPFAATPWVVPPQRYSGRCEQANGANVLMLQSIGNAPKLNSSPDRTWGQHLADLNIALGDLIDLVGRQADAYLAVAPPAGGRLRARLGYARGRDAAGRRCARSAIRVALVGAGARAVESMVVRVNGRRVASDRRPPFRRTIARRYLRAGDLNRVEVAARRAGQVTRLTRSLRTC